MARAPFRKARYVLQVFAVGALLSVVVGGSGSGGSNLGPLESGTLAEFASDLVPLASDQNLNKETMDQPAQIATWVPPPFSAVDVESFIPAGEKIFVQVPWQNPEGAEPQSAVSESAEQGSDGDTRVLSSGAISPAPNVEADQPPRILTHIVKEGETLWDIAKAYNIDVDTLLASNTLRNENRIQVGQKLNVPTVKGALHTVDRGESLWEIARYYGVSMESIVEANSLSSPESLVVDQKLIIPGAEYSRDQQRLVSSDGRLLPAFSKPVTGRISSHFGLRWGRMHEGVDIAVPTGTSVKAAADGKVTYSGYLGGYGYLVVIDHGKSVETRYGHNSKLLVSEGQWVKRGQIIAKSGNTGRSTGPHVHFEIRYRGTPVNPVNYWR